MAHSTFAQPLSEQFRAQAAKGYRSASDAPSEFEIVVTRPAGSMTATAADMGRFMLAHLQQGSLDGNAILDPATTALMHSPSQSGLPGFAAMAHGFFTATQNGRTVIGHGGDTIVFHTELSLLPQDGVGIFFSFNSRGKDSAVYGARKELFDGFMDRYFPVAQIDPPQLASAASDAQQIAGRYQSSRRIENGFLSVLYLLSQTVITAHPDGTITTPSGIDGSVGTYREVGPQLWRKQGGTQTLAFQRVNGVKTVIDSENPVSVLQDAPFLRSAPLNLTVMSLSLAVLLCTLVLWPLGAVLRRADRATSTAPAGLPRLRLVQRLAVAVVAVYLFAWFKLIQPVLSSDLGIYSTANDGLVRLLQAAGVLAVAAAGAGLWAAWRMQSVGASRLSRLWSVLVALALLGVLWIAAIGGLLSWNLNY
jgi:hypothetical protein